MPSKIARDLLKNTPTSTRSMVREYGNNIVKMKPTARQVEIATAIAREIAFFAGTNDIDSPSHHTMIDETLEELNLSVQDDRDLDSCLMTILDIIRRNK